MNTQELNETIAYYTDTIRVNPKNHDAYTFRGYAYGEKGDWNKAITDFTEAIRLTHCCTSYRARGNAYYAIGDWDKAIADFTEAIRLYPKDSYAYGRRSEAYQKKGEMDKAKADESKAKEISVKVRTDQSQAEWIGVIWVAVAVILGFAFLCYVFSNKPNFLNFLFGGQ